MDSDINLSLGKVLWAPLMNSPIQLPNLNSPGLVFDAIFLTRDVH